MKKLLVMLLIAILALSATAFAATYNYDNDITFEYDENAIEITYEDHEDDIDYIVMGYKNSAFGDGYVSIQRAEIPDGQQYPSREEIAERIGADVSKLEDLPTWGNFTNVITYTATTDGFTETTFIAPLYDDGKADGMLTVIIGTTELDDEAAAQDRDDAISAIVDTLKADD